MDDLVAVPAYREWRWIFLRPHCRNCGGPVHIDHFATHQGSSRSYAYLGCMACHRTWVVAEPEPCAPPRSTV